MDRRALLRRTGTALVAAFPISTVAAKNPGNTGGFETNDKGATDGVVEAAIGEPIEGDTLHLVVEEVTSTTDMLATVGDDQRVLGNLFVRMAIKNVTDAFLPVYGWLDTRIHDDEDYTYDKSSLGHPFNEGYIAPGEVERDYIGYEIPEDASGLVVEFDFDDGDGMFDRVMIDLEREHENPVILEQDLGTEILDVGDTIEWERTQVTLNEVETAVEIGEFAEAEEGYEFVIADAAVSNNTGEERTLDADNQMYLKDRNRFSYNVDWNATPYLDRGFELYEDILPNDRLQGQTAFTMQEGLEPLYWVFDTEDFPDAKRAFWQIREAD